MHIETTFICETSRCLRTRLVTQGHSYLKATPKYHHLTCRMADIDRARAVEHLIHLKFGCSCSRKRRRHQAHVERQRHWSSKTPRQEQRATLQGQSNHSLRKRRKRAERQRRGTQTRLRSSVRSGKRPHDAANDARGRSQPPNQRGRDKGEATQRATRRAERSGSGGSVTETTHLAGRTDFRAVSTVALTCASACPRL